METKNFLSQSGGKPDVTRRQNRNGLGSVISRLSLGSIVSRFSLVSLICVLMLTLGVGNAWGAVEYESLYTCDFTTVANHSYTQNKTFTLNSKSWTASVSQVSSSVFYLGCNSNNASKGILNNNATFSAIVTALRNADSYYNGGSPARYLSAHAYALLFENAYDNVTKVNFSWSGGNNAFQVYLFGYTGSAWVKLANTNYVTSGTSTSGSVEWTGDATNYTKFAIAARPGTTSSAATSKTLRAASFTIYKTKASTYTVQYANGGGGGTNPGAHENVAAGAKVTLKANTFTAPAGKQFSSWSDGSNTYSVGYQYTVNSNVTMTAQWTCITPTISSQTIANATYVVNQSPVTALSVTASGGTLSYQWQSSSSENGTYSNVSGATSSSFTPPVTSASDLWYKCVVKNTGSSCNTTVTSNKAHIVVSEPSCVAATSVTITGTTKYLGEQTISLTAEPSGGSGTISYQWQKKIEGTWQNVTNGTTAGVTISGATGANLQISPCTHENSGGYRCIVTRGADCVKKSHEDDTNGYGVHVFSLNGGYYGQSWSPNEIVWSSGTTGTATVHLNASSTYMFKVYSNHGYYYGNGENNYIIQPVTWNCGTGNQDMRLLTGPEGDYTFTVNIEHGLDGSPYVSVQVGYPSVSHPSTGYMYINKWWGTCYIHYWEGTNNALSTWGSDPAINSDRYIEICGTNYWYFPVIDTYNKVIAKDAAGDPGNTTGDQVSTSNGGKYITHDGSWGWHTFNKYTVSYNANGGTGTMGSHTELCPGSTQAVSANTFTKSHYHFTGWIANVDVTINNATVTQGTLITGTPTLQNIQSNITLTAQWEINSKTLTWNWNGGSTTSTSYTLYPATSGSVEYGTTITYPANNTMSKSGYAFAGWSSSPGTMPDNNLTITAQWNPQVTWMAGGEVFNTQSGTVGTALTNPGTPDAATYCPGGKVFVGWTATEITGDPTNTEPADLFTSVSGMTIPAGGTSYYAVFATVTGTYGKFKRVTQLSDITEGGKIAIVHNKNSKILGMADNGGSYTSETAPSETSSKIDKPSANNTWTLSKDGNYWIFTNCKATSKKVATNGTSSTTTLNASTQTYTKWEIGSNSDITNGFYLRLYGTSITNMALQFYNSNWQIYSASTPNYTTNTNLALKLYVPDYTATAYATSCTTVNVTGVTVSPSTKAILVGETAQLTATIAPNNATDKSVTWSSGTPANATVNSSGVVTGVAKGTSTVTATTTDGGFTSSCAVTVHNITVQAKDVDGTDISSTVTASATGKSLSAAGASNYVFKTWKYATGGQGGLDAIPSATSTSTTLTGTPTGDVTVIAEFYKPVTVTFVNGMNQTHDTKVVGCGGTPTKPASNPSACDASSTTFMGWTQKAWVGKKPQSYVDGLTDPDKKVYLSGDNLPAVGEDDVTYYPVYALSTSTVTTQTASFGFEEASPSAWTITNINQYSDYSATGDYSGKPGDNGSGNILSPVTIQYKTKLSTPISISFKSSKSNSKSNESNWHVQSSSNGSSWSTVTDGTGPTNSELSQGVFSDPFEVDLSSLSNVYIRIEHGGSSPASLLDDIVLSYSAGGTTYSDYLTTCCTNLVALSEGTKTNCTSITFSSNSQPTCSSTDSERQVTVTVTPATGYEMTSSARLTFTPTDGDPDPTATYKSGPTAVGATYQFVYEFNKDDAGAGTFSAECTAKSYTVYLDQSTATTAGTASVTVTYGETCPAIASFPKKTDCYFDGYYYDQSFGTASHKVVNTGGTWVKNVTNYITNYAWTRDEDGVTLYPKWTDRGAKNYRTNCPSFAVFNQDGTSAADIHLTSTKDVEIYASEAAGNLIRIIASGLDAYGDHPKIGVEYYDANNADALVTGTDRVFRLSNSSSYDFEDDLLDLGENTTEYDQTFSIYYTPKDYNQSHHYKLKLILRNNNTEKDNVTIHLYGRSLPKEFVIAAKSGDTWYALPNTLAVTESAQGAITPTAITVDNATTPTKAVNPVGTVIYGACNKFTNGNRSGLRFTSDGAHWIQTSSTASVYKMWLSNTGYTNAQDWYLKSSDLCAYEVFMDPIGSPDDKRRIELYNSSGVKMGYHNTGSGNARTGVGNIYLLPVEFPSITTSIMEWGTDHVVIDLRTPGSSTKVKTQVSGGTIGGEQALSEVKKDEGVYRVAVTLSSSDALKDLKLYFYDDLDVLQGVAAFTIPRIVSSSTTTGSFGTPFKKDAPFVDLVILNGATLTVSETTVGTKFTFRNLYVYGGGKMVVPTGTYIDFSNVYLRGGHLNASWNYVYSHPQLVLNGTMGNTSNTINYDYLTNNAQFYSLALPYDVTLSNIVNPDFNNKQSWLIHAYDGALRASGSAVAGWYDVEEGSTIGGIDPLGSSDALTAGMGYTFFGAMQKVNSIRQKWSVNRFPMTLASGSPEEAKSGVSVTAHGMTDGVLNDGVAPNDAGWNMLGNPFLADIGGTETYETAVKGTILSYHNVKTLDANNNWTGGWHWEENETNVRYVRIPNDYGTEYEQVRFKDAVLKAFHHFFIQAGASGTFSFDLSMRAQSMPQRIRRGKLLLPEEMDVDFRLSKGETNTKFGLTLSDDFSSDYVMNEDIAEDLSGESMKAYTLISDQRVTYNGLPFTAAQQLIPVGFRAPNAGEYVFSYISDVDVAEHIEHIYLTDKRLGVTTDLKEQSYLFASEIGVVDDRFILQIVFKSDVTTEIESDSFERENGRPVKFIYQGRLYIMRYGIIYDAVGRKVGEVNK